LAGRPQEAGCQQDDRALDEAEQEEGVLIAAGLDHGCDRQNGEHGARAIAGSGEANGEAALVREPLQRAVHAGCVDAADADAADDGADIKAGERAGVGIHDPGQTSEQTAHEHHGARAVLVDEVTFDRGQPGLHNHEDREGDLDRRTGPAMRALNLRHEQRPRILDVRRRHHADDACNQLKPAICRNNCSPCWSG